MHLHQNIKHALMLFGAFITKMKYVIVHRRIEVGWMGCMFGEDSFFFLCRYLVHKVPDGSEPQHSLDTSSCCQPLIAP
jgi:hypothetical protein